MADMEGIILEVTEKEILFFENLSRDKYEEIKNVPIATLLEQEKRTSFIYLTYDGTEAFSVGDEVAVWIDGDILLSYPGQAKAKKIELKN